MQREDHPIRRVEEKENVEPVIKPAVIPKNNNLSFESNLLNVSFPSNYPNDIPMNRPSATNPVRRAPPASVIGASVNTSQDLSTLIARVNQRPPNARHQTNWNGLLGNQPKMNLYFEQILFLKLLRLEIFLAYSLFNLTKQ